MTTQQAITSETEFAAAVATAKAAAAAYYDTDQLTMTDAAYDELADAIAAAVATHPQWDDAGLLSAVAAGASAGGTLAHPTPMLSLAKTTDITAIAAFTTAAATVMCVEAKLDGNAVRALYRDGQLTELATRGDGFSGEPLDLTLNIAGLPSTISLPGTVHVRGEVFMTRLPRGA